MHSSRLANRHRARAAIFIAWKRDCFRSYQTAKLLGCRLILIWPFDSRGIVPTVARYIVSSALTVLILLRERPRRLVILNLPLPLAVIAALYRRLFDAELIFDCHSKPYADNCPLPERLAYPFLSRVADLNINHNDRDASVVRKWHGRNVVLKALPFALPREAGTPERAVGSPYVLCVCSFARDEPIELVIRLARALPDISIRMTGNYRRHPAIGARSLPHNLSATGYLSVPEYYREFANAAVVLSLSANGWIMHMASEEAMLLGVPLVLSRSDAVEQVLGDAGVFVDLSEASIAAGLRDALARRQLLATRMRVAAARQRRVAMTTLVASGLISSHAVGSAELRSGAETMRA